jgi:lipoprotein-anchoring transpeptidase ErfK/SrfK
MPSAAGSTGSSKNTSDAKATWFARAMVVYVYSEPKTSSPKLGEFRAGAEVAASGSPEKGEGCTGLWLPVLPKGYACTEEPNNKLLTQDATDPIVVATRERRPSVGSGLPYGYAVVRNSGAPFYSRFPTDTEAKVFEADFDSHFRALDEAEEKEAREGGYPRLRSMPKGKAELRIEPEPGVLPSWATDNRDDDVRAFFSEDFAKGKARVPDLAGLTALKRADACDPSDKRPGGCIPLDLARPIKRLGISFIASFATEARRFLVTPDLTIMAADRARLVRGTSFQGTQLREGEKGEGLSLPIIFPTKAGAKRYTLKGKRLEEAGELGFRVPLEATSKQRKVGGKMYYVLKSGELVLNRDAVRLDPIRKMPKWGKEGERWIEINLTKQTLLAVDGGTPVYATLVSTGAGGVSEDVEKNPYVTPRGIFRIHTKYTAATMDSKQPEAEFELRDVPYVQYFKDGYALHAAYWHDQFGLPRSHGCINLAPKDAAWLFGFSKPEVPSSWHGAMLPLRGTVVWIHP